MAFTLEKVVPWGRSFDEYVAMFALSKHDLEKRILGCGDGPASFNATHFRHGGKIISADPLYQFSADEIRCRIEATYQKVIEQTRLNSNEFVWGHIPNVEALGRIRTDAMEEFLSDYPSGVTEKRYVEASLPKLPFSDMEFDISLCSHFLFLYSEQYSADFHMRSIIELCRVARDVRIFPLLELGTMKSRHLDFVIAQLRAEGFIVSINTVSYEFQKGGNQMLRITIPVR